MLIVAERQKTHRAHFSGGRDLDCHPGFRNNAGKHINRYYSRSVHTMEHQHRGRNNLISRHLPCAADSDDLLLFSRCLLTENQGIYQHTVIHFLIHLPAGFAVNFAVHAKYYIVH